MERETDVERFHLRPLRSIAMCLGAVLCIVFAIYAAEMREQEDPQALPLNPGAVPTSAPLLLLLDGNGTYQPGIEYYSRRMIPGEYDLNSPRIPMENAVSTTVRMPLSFLFTSDRYPDLLEFRYVDQSNNETVEPMVCRLYLTDTWRTSEERDNKQCSASRNESGWNVVLGPKRLPYPVTYMTVVAIWYPGQPGSNGNASNPEDGFAFTASWLFRLRFI